MKKFLLALLLPLLFLSGFFLINLSPPGHDTSTVTFVINRGDGLATIARRLQKNHLIRQQHVFIVYSYLMGLNKSLQMGGFKLSPSLSTRQVIDKLSQGGNHDFWLKIQEGWRLEEIALNLPDQVSFTSADFLSAVSGQEGYIFPDSYLIPSDYGLDQLLGLVKKNFDKKLAQAKQNQTTDLDDSQTIILASLLEREAKSSQNRRLVAGILLNRFNIGMGLQVDATVQYTRDSRISPQKYWQSPTSTDLKINSAYNTYQNRGLPPAPICNPSLDSLTAAFHPTDSDYLYYLTGNDGHMYYAKNYQDHQQNIQKYLR